MRSAWKSDRGLVRENNEDYVLVDEGNGIFLLADGMGGGPAVEVASRLAATTAHVTLKTLFRGSGPKGGRSAVASRQRPGCGAFHRVHAVRMPLS